ncbi:MAG: N-carbamoylputrescine amidase [Solirubrobacteraceae bacterium]|nr:N-carbamoylputrescine amidase [Solirubrobacteraceae bacterium]
MSAPGPNSTVRVALAQIDCALGDVAENARRAHEAVARAREAGADLVVFPELSLTGYALGGVTEDVAIELDDPAITGLAAAADGIAAVVGCVESGRVHTYNSALYLDGGAIVHVQRKTHLPTYGRWEEDKYFSRGPALRAFDTRLGRSAILICNDAWQAPLPYLAVHDGARLLIVPACSSLDAAAGTDPAELERDWADLLRVNARFLQAWIVFVNRVGEESGVTFWGGSRIVDPWGNVVVQAPRGEAALVHADLDVGAVRRRRREMPLLKEPRLGLIRREVDRLLDAAGDA